MREDRVGSRCWYKTFICDKFVEWRGGTLRAWSTDDDLGAVAIIEDDKTQCVEVAYAGWVSFAATPE